MKILGNIIWLVFGGILVFVEYLIAGVVMLLTIIGIPWGIQSFKLAGLALWPFGREVRDNGSASGCLNIVLNIIWILIGGIWIALSHLLFGILLAITIIGIPFARQHFKLAGLALTPFGKEVM